jgi:hypothetical protein
MWDLMQVKEKTGIELSESLAMLPAASVSGLYFAHPQAHYFAVGKLQLDQVCIPSHRAQHSYPLPRWRTTPCGRASPCRRLSAGSPSTWRTNHGRNSL